MWKCGERKRLQNLRFSQFYSTNANPSSLMFNGYLAASHACIINHHLSELIRNSINTTFANNASLNATEVPNRLCVTRSARTGSRVRRQKRLPSAIFCERARTGFTGPILSAIIMLFTRALTNKTINSLAYMRYRC